MRLPMKRRISGGFKSYKSDKSKLNSLLKKQSESKKEQEYNTFY
jgi:hypothetical protein